MSSAEAFKEHFCWVMRPEEDDNLKKLEAWVRYYFVLKGSLQAVKDHVSEFDQHFGEACRDVAAAQGVEWEEPDVSDSSDIGRGTLTACRFRHRLLDGRD
jgi:hypothetical protein